MNDRTSQTASALLITSVIALLILFFGSRGVQGAPLPGPIAGIEDARVTLPYAEVRRLWEASRSAAAPKPKERPPMSAVVTSAEYRVEADDERTRIHARFHIRVLEEQWQMVRLIGGDFLLDSAVIEGGNGDVIHDDGYYQLLSHDPGAFDVALELTAPPASRWEKGKGITILPAVASSNRVRIPKPSEEGGRRIVPKTGLLSGADLAETSVYHVIHPRARESRSKIVLEVEDPVSPSSVPLPPSRWETSSESLVQVSGNRLVFEAELYCRTDGGAAKTIELDLPAATQKIEVSSPEVARWSTSRQDNGTQRIWVEWTEAGVFEHTLTIGYEIPFSPLSTEWTLVRPSSRSTVIRNEGNTVLSPSFFAVIGQEGTLLGGDSIRDRSEVPPLPSWMEKLLDRRTYTPATSPTPSLTLSVRRLPRIEANEATVASATFRTEIVADGSALTEARLALHHQTSTALELDLPAGNQILAAVVTGSQVTPIQTGDHRIMIPLPPPRSSGETSEVTFSYTQKYAPFDPVSGRIDVVLPRTALFIRSLRWAVSLPGGYQAEAAEGNVELLPGEGGPNQGGNRSEITLTKNLCRGETPTAEIYYQRRETGTGHRNQ